MGTWLDGQAYKDMPLARPGDRPIRTCRGAQARRDWPKRDMPIGTWLDGQADKDMPLAQPGDRPIRTCR